MHFTVNRLLYWPRGKGNYMDIMYSKRTTFTPTSERATAFFEENFGAPVVVVDDGSLQDFLAELPKDWVIGDQNRACN